MMTDRERLVAVGELVQMAQVDDDIKTLIAAVTSRQGRSIGEIARDSPETFEMILETARSMMRVTADLDGIGPSLEPGGIDEIEL